MLSKDFQETFDFFSDVVYQARFNLTDDTVSEETRKRIIKQWSGMLWVLRITPPITKQDLKVRQLAEQLHDLYRQKLPEDSKECFRAMCFRDHIEQRLLIAGRKA